jgi:DNA-binding response OmpR family regulator
MNYYGKILLVEDFADSRFMLRRLLELEGFAVIEACDGDVALDALRKHSCDAILLDLKMPNLDGIQFTKALRATTQFKTVPIIIVSAYDDDLTKAEAHAAGCNDYFTKPIDLEKLSDSLRKFIEQAFPTGH